MLTSCQTKESSTLKNGVWRLTLDLGNGKELPVQLIVDNSKNITIINDQEEILVTDINIMGDSITFRPPIFEGVFKGVFLGDQLIQGDFIKPSLDRVVKFTMTYGNNYRFKTTTKESTTNITGKWETVFSPNKEADRYIAQGIFKQVGEHITGTFRTTTGDYRYLDGVIENNKIKL